MPAEQEIVHWYNQIPSVENGFIAEDDPSITDYSDMVNRSFHDDYTADRITKLRDLLDRLCNDIGSITYNITYDVVNIVARGLPNDTTFSFSLQQWLTDEREVKRYLREWFPSFNIPYTMGGIANHIATITPTVESIRRYMDTAELTAISAPTPTQAMLMAERDRYARSIGFTGIYSRRTGLWDTSHSYTIPIEPHSRNPFNDRIVETLTQVATGLDTQLHYAITDTHVTIEDRSFNPVHTLSLRLDVFEARALPILEISRRIQRERESRRNTASPYQFEFPRRDNGYSEGRRRLPLNPTPNMAIRPLDDSTNPSTCNGKEEAPYTNYLDVI